MHVLNTYKGMSKTEEVEPVLRLYSWDWKRIDFEHPATFDTLAMDYDQKKAIMEDLERFLARKDFYRRVGRAWERGYPLYGPPETGKSSLIAAMANYWKFDVCDLELSNISSNSDLKKANLETDNKTIIVIENIDCSSEVLDRSKSSKSYSKNVSPNKTLFIAFDFACANHTSSLNLNIMTKIYWPSFSIPIHIC